MKRTSLQQRILMMTVPLAISFLAVRFVLFGLHHMTDGCVLALIPAFIGIVYCVCGDGRITVTGTLNGYLVSFFIGYFFHKEYIDPNHGNAKMSNFFSIWLISYAVIIIVCIIIDEIHKRRYPLEHYGYPIEH